MNTANADITPLRPAARCQRVVGTRTPGGPGYEIDVTCDKILFDGLCPTHDINRAPDGTVRRYRYRTLQWFHVTYEVEASSLAEANTVLVHRTAGHTLYVRCPVVTGYHQIRCAGCEEIYQTPYDDPSFPLPIDWLAELQVMHQENLRIAQVHPLALAVWAEKYPGEPYPSAEDAAEWELTLTLALQTVNRPGGE